jgi:AcrR family transcriptional regulator
MGRPRSGANVDTRGRILRAAVAEFERHGYDASGVERISRKARVNKALIYYYFGSKLRLYQEILHGSLAGLVGRLKAVLEERTSAEQKLARYVETLVDYLDAHPHLAPILLRELADGGRHLDVTALEGMLEIPPLLARLVAQGRSEQAFVAYDPLVLHFILLGTTLLMASNMPIRKRIRQLGLAEPPVDTSATTSALLAVARRLLRKDHSDA